MTEYQHRYSAGAPRVCPFSPQLTVLLIMQVLYVFWELLLFFDRIL